MKNRNQNHKDDWATPPYVYEKLDEEFNFTFDPTPFQHDMIWDGLKREWNTRNYLNPPYSNPLKEMFVRKAIEEGKKGKLVVALLPCSTSTKLFHDHILPNAKEIRFVKGRIPFIGIDNKGRYVNWHLWDKPSPKGVIHVKNSGQNDSIIVIFDKKRWYEKTKFKTIKY